MSSVNNTEAEFLAAVLDRIQDLELEVGQLRRTTEALQAEKQHFYPDNPVSILRDLIWAAIGDPDALTDDYCTLQYLPRASGVSPCFCFCLCSQASCQ